jgi:hypothetical protein
MNISFIVSVNIPHWTTMWCCLHDFNKCITVFFSYCEDLLELVGPFIIHVFGCCFCCCDSINFQWGSQGAAAPKVRSPV